MRCLFVLALLATSAHAAPQVTIANVTGAEDGGKVPVRIHRSQLNGQPTRIRLQTVAGSASATDFVPFTVDIDLPASAKDVYRDVVLLNDALPEASETFTVKATILANGRCNDCTALVTITDSDVAPPVVVPPSIVVPPVVTEPPPVVTLEGLAPIPSNFDYQLAIGPATPPPPKTTAILHDRGAFRFICGAGQLLRDDPIVYPGQPGKSHLHQFYGNRLVNANSTFPTVRSTGSSTCNNLAAGSPEIADNRSAYWMPAMLDGKGNVVQPNYVKIYYKRIPNDSADCGAPGSGTAHNGMGYCVGIPNGLRFIFGYDMLTSTSPTGGLGFTCIGGTDASWSKDLVEAGPKCAVAKSIDAVISAPECWNGKDLDSLNHRDHVSYGFRNAWGQIQCPLTHPYVMPRFQMSANYTIVAGDNVADWLFSSDEMHPELPHGTTFHADYLEGWDPIVKAMWQDNCIGRNLDCTLGNTGSGYGLRGADVPRYNGVSSWTNPNRLVPIP